MTTTPTSTIRESQLFIGGEWTHADGDIRDLLSPRTEEVVAVVGHATCADVERAVEAAAAAWPRWSAKPAGERSALLRQVANRIEAMTDDFAKLIELELGSPPEIARRLHVDVPIKVIRATADALDEFAFEETIGNSTIFYEPVGVVAAITPWNLPLHQIVAKVVPAIAAGCSVVLKPAALTPLSAYALARVFELADLPEGVFNVIAGDGQIIGEALASHPAVDLVSFTGSTSVGRRIAELAAANITRVTLELGGKSASILLPGIGDDQLEAAVKVTVANCFLNSGQTCTAWSRLVVPAARLAAVEQLATAAASKYIPGSSRLGPLISAGQRESVLSYLSRDSLADAKVLLGGPDGDVPSKGYFVPPTVISRITSDHRLAQEEIFGPVLAILSYEDLEDATRIANDSIYGLSGAVWGPEDEAHLFARRMRTGMIDINGGSFNAAAPFGGYKQSGYGRELGRFGIADCLLAKAVQS